MVVLAIIGAAFWFRPVDTLDFLQPGHLAEEVIIPLARVMLFMAAGLSVAMVVEALGWSARLGRVVAPLTNWGGLPPVAASSFTVAILSHPTAMALLSEAWDKKEISLRSLVVANLMNSSWPTFIVHLPTTLVVSTSLAGSVGLAYTGLMFSAATLRLIGATILGRIILPSPLKDSCEKIPPPKKTLKEIWPDLGHRLGQRLLSLVSLAAPIYFLITLLVDLGIFEMGRKFFTAHSLNIFLPMEAALVVIFSFMAEFSSGFMAAGVLVDNLGLTWPEATAALLLGNVIASPIRVLRWQLPSYLGFFTAGLGIFIILCNQSFRIASLLISLFIFWQIFGG